MHREDTVLIPLRARDGSVKGHVTVDAADADWVNQWRWSLSSSDGYAYRSENQRSVRLHRALLGLVPGDGMETDHIDRDRLNCRRSNLRALPKDGRPNMQNKPSYAGSSSQYRGVSWHRGSGKWQARVQINGRMVHLGRFTEEREAAEATRTARTRLMPYAVD